MRACHACAGTHAVARARAYTVTCEDAPPRAHANSHVKNSQPCAAAPSSQEEARMLKTPERTALSTCSCERTLAHAPRQRMQQPAVHNRELLSLRIVLLCTWPGQTYLVQTKSVLFAHRSTLQHSIILLAGLHASFFLPVSAPPLSAFLVTICCLDIFVQPFFITSHLLLTAQQLDDTCMHPGRNAHSNGAL
eukprot:6206549-Pleurochrysis_carterae.AAC.1